MKLPLDLLLITSQKDETFSFQTILDNLPPHFEQSVKEISFLIPCTQISC